MSCLWLKDGLRGRAAEVPSAWSGRRALDAYREALARRVARPEEFLGAFWFSSSGGTLRAEQVAALPAWALRTAYAALAEVASLAVAEGRRALFWVEEGWSPEELEAGMRFADDCAVVGGFGVSGGNASAGIARGFVEMRGDEWPAWGWTAPREAL